MGSDGSGLGFWNCWIFKANWTRFFFLFCQIFAILDDFSKWIIVPKVIKNTIPIEKSSNMAKIWGKMKKNNIGYQHWLTKVQHWLTNVGKSWPTVINLCWCTNVPRARECTYVNLYYVRTSFTSFWKTMTASIIRIKQCCGWPLPQVFL